MHFLKNAVTDSASLQRLLFSFFAACRRMSHTALFDDKNVLFRAEMILIVGPLWARGCTCHVSSLTVGHHVAEVLRAHAGPDGGPGVRLGPAQPTHGGGVHGVVGLNMKPHQTPNIAYRSDKAI